MLTIEKYEDCPNCGEVERWIYDAQKCPACGYPPPSRLELLQKALAEVQQMVSAQAEDEGLWFQAATAPEAYLQQELRKLHALIEGIEL